MAPVPRARAVGNINGLQQRSPAPGPRHRYLTTQTKPPPASGADGTEHISSLLAGRVNWPD